MANKTMPPAAMNKVPPMPANKMPAKKKAPPKKVMPMKGAPKSQAQGIMTQMLDKENC